MHGLDVSRQFKSCNGFARWQVEVTFEEARAHLGLNLNVNGHHGRLPALPCATCPVQSALVAHQQLLCSV